MAVLVIEILKGILNSSLAGTSNEIQTGAVKDISALSKSEIGTGAEDEHPARVYLKTGNMTNSEGFFA